MFLSNILYKLAFPSVIFAAILYLPKQIIRGRSVDITSFLHDTIMGGSMWFTSALSVAELMIFVVLLTRCRNIWIYLAYGVASAYGAFLLFKSDFSPFVDPHVPWYYKSGFSAVLFMSCGGLYWKYEKIVDAFINRGRYIMILLLILAYVIWSLYYYKYFSGNLYLPLNVPTVPIVLIGSYLIIRLSKILPSFTSVDYMGRHSIGLYFLSGALPNTIAVILKYALPETAILPLTTWLLSIMIAIPSVVLINKYAPFLYDFRLFYRRKK